MRFLTDQRVVIAGVGIVTANACGKNAFWDSLLRGHSGTKRITRFDPSSYRSQIAGCCRKTNPKTALINMHGLGGINMSTVVQRVDV